MLLSSVGVTASNALRKDALANHGRSIDATPRRSRQIVFLADLLRVIGATSWRHPTLHADTQRLAASSHSTKLSQPVVANLSVTHGTVHRLRLMADSPRVDRPTTYQCTRIASIPHPDMVPQPASLSTPWHGPRHNTLLSCADLKGSAPGLVSGPVRRDDLQFGASLLGLPGHHAWIGS